jgi:hypothetical protein
MGDFNDTPQDSSMQLLVRSKSLTNLFDRHDLSQGSHKYQGEWAYLDQIIVSSEVLKGSLSSGTICDKFLLVADRKYAGFKVNRGFQGPYLGKGFSDHLPVFFEWSE